MTLSTAPHNKAAENPDVVPSQAGIRKKTLDAGVAMHDGGDYGHLFLRDRAQ